MPQTDSIGRATFHHIVPQHGVLPTEREVRWFKHIERHGPQSSSYLFELTRDTHRCRDTSLRQMQKLRAGGFLRLPLQQRHIAKADFNPYIYDLAQAARDHLREHALAEPTVRPQGHWWHSYAVSCVTSAIEIAAARDGVRFIPTHEILAIKNTSLAVPIGRQRLIPDQLFALDYGGSFRVFALEVDRGTEPKVSANARKSWFSSIALYGELLARRLWKTHYGLSANLLALWVFSSTTRAEGFLKLAGEHGGAVAASTLATTAASVNCLSPSALIETVYGKPWERHAGSPLSIGTR